MVPDYESNRIESGRRGGAAGKFDVYLVDSREIRVGFFSPESEVMGCYSLERNCAREMGVG